MVSGANSPAKSGLKVPWATGGLGDFDRCRKKGASSARRASTQPTFIFPPLHENRFSFSVGPAGSLTDESP